ncbi:hypothetical protein TI04_04965 [Achromatium sp. WMS2]|nr:hypothetical protein TI04_04965 [Achromatium sp. WMS2]
MINSNMRPRRPDSPDLNVTSLVDVVLLLLLFFMLSTTFNHPTQIPIELPKAGAEASSQETNDIEVSIDKEGNYFINGTAVPNPTLVNLANSLKRVSNHRLDLTIQINADANSSHQSVITIMDAARHVGLTQFAFVAIDTANSE